MTSRGEIGSEFWFDDVLPIATTERDGVYTISGRTAIDVIIQDILATRTAKNVYMPAWVCDSMIVPFLDRGIKVDLYDVSLNGQLKYAVDENHKVDIFYVSNYFGYDTTIPLEIISKFKQKKSVIIYDRTHSMLMDDEPYKTTADYSFASIRKWMGVMGGAFVEGVKNKSLKHCPFLDSKGMAMRMKQAYINGDGSVDKQEFLHLYGVFGHQLEEDFRDYAMDDLSYAIYRNADFSAMMAQRRVNAQYLHNHLNLHFFSPLTSNGCPLFVPVFFSNKEERDHVRRILIEAKIYCPIHWSKPAMIPADFKANKIYDTELSLICDQRYTTEDMQRIVDVINEMNINE